MAVIPTADIFGPALSSAASPESATFEGLMRGLGGIGPAISAAVELANSAQANREARSAANYKRAEALKSLAADLTYGGESGGALGQALKMKGSSGASYPGRSRRGSAPQAGPRFPLQQAESRAESLAEIADALARRQQMPSALQQIQMMTPGGQAVPEGAQGMRNVAAERLGLSSRQIVKPETLFQLAELIRSGDPTVGPLLSGLGLPEDMGYQELVGLGSKAREYESRLADDLIRTEAESSPLDLAQRALLMRERLRAMGYDSDNIEELAKEIARMDDQSAEAIMAEIGRPGKYAQEIDVEKLKQNRRTTVHNIYSGLQPKGGSKDTGSALTILNRHGFAKKADLLAELKVQQSQMNKMDKRFGTPKSTKDPETQKTVFVIPGMTEEQQAEYDGYKARAQHLQRILDEVTGFEDEGEDEGEEGASAQGKAAGKSSKKPVVRERTTQEEKLKRSVGMSIDNVIERLYPAGMDDRGLKEKIIRDKNTGQKIIDAWLDSSSLYFSLENGETVEVERPGRR